MINMLLIKFIFYFLFFIFSHTLLLSQDISEELKENIIKSTSLNSGTLSSVEVLPKPETNIIEISENREYKISDYSELQYFGYDYFFNRKQLNVYDNFPIPDDYKLGPGDEILIHIWGEVQLQSSYIINREGFLFIDKIGQVSIVGLTILEARDYIKSLFESVISTLKNPNPSTFFNLTIGKLKSINIQFIGEVYLPGIHALHPLSTALTALVQVEGIRQTGSLREIQLIRKNGKVLELDFYSYLLSGNNEIDMKMQDGDIIFVPVRNSSVSIMGAVIRPGIYEILEEETLDHLLSYSGGLKSTAQGSLFLERIQSFEDRLSEDFAKKKYNISLENKEFRLKDGDQIFINPIMDVENYVTILGKIKKPGEHPYFDGMTLTDILNQAGGINDSSYNKSMDIENIEIIRRDKNELFPKRILFDFNKIIEQKKTDIIVLENLDLIVVRANINYDPPEIISILGEVISPGDYTIISKDDNVKSLIQRAGGLTERGYRQGIKIYRNDIPIIVENFDLKLLDGDKIIVPKKTNVVHVSGEVFYPGFIQFKSGESVEYYIEKAGNFNFKADKKNLIVIYPNGNVEIMKAFRRPKIIDGCQIIVYEKEQKDELNITELLKETASIVASLTTIIFLINAN